MCNEWRDNIWLILELAVVSAAMGVVLITVVSILEVKTRPMGIGPIDDIYVADFSTLNEESERYEDYGDRKYELEARDMCRVVAALRKNPYVEKAGLVCNGLPFTLNYWGNMRDFVVDGDTLAYYFNMRCMSPEAAEILGIGGNLCRCRSCAETRRDCHFRLCIRRRREAIRYTQACRSELCREDW